MRGWWGGKARVEPFLCTHSCFGLPFIRCSSILAMLWLTSYITCMSRSSGEVLNTFAKAYNRIWQFFKIFSSTCIFTVIKSNQDFKISWKTTDLNSQYKEKFYLSCAKCHARSIHPCKIRSCRHAFEIILP